MKLLVKLVALILVSLALNTAAPVLAATITPSPTVTPSEASVSAEQIQQSIQDRIKRAIQDNLGKAEQYVERPRLRAFIGKVETITEATLNVATTNGGGQSISKQVVTNDDTIIVKSGKTKIKFSDISLQDNIIAMGITGDNQTMTALRLVVGSQPSPTIVTEIVNGTISSFAPKTRVITLDTASPALVGKDIIISRNAKLYSSDLKPLALTDIEESMNIVAVVETDIEEETNVIYRLMVFPDALSPTPTLANTGGTCGDNICQNVVCAGLGCPTPETVESCPQDCSTQPK